MQRHLESGLTRITQTERRKEDQLAGAKGLILAGDGGVCGCFGGCKASTSNQVKSDGRSVRLMRQQ
jgi:hypothetical protein